MELHNVDPDRLLGDKAYDSDAFRNDLADRGIEPVIPPRSNRKTPIEYDREAYKRRNLIERCVNRLKQFHRIATRCEKPPEPIFRRYVSRHQSCGTVNTRASIHSTPLT
jgi:transposase